MIVVLAALLMAFRIAIRDLRERGAMDLARCLRWKTPIFLLLVILSNLGGDVCLRFGLRQTGNLLVKSPSAYLQVFFTPWVGFAVTFYLVWIFAQMALVS